jgi:hypothetical protein
VESIHADIAGLSALGSRYLHHAGALTSSGPAPAVGRGFQATSAAVAAVHTDADVAEATFVQRLAATASTVVSAAHGYALTEASNAAWVAAFAETEAF